MQLDGGCYCGAVRYRAAGEPVFRGECLCRECQYITGGGPNFFVMMRAEDFAYTKGTPAQFTRDDLDTPRTRDFCPTCGTHLVTRQPGGRTLVVKVGTLDDPAVFGGPDMAIHVADAQPFHCFAEGLPRHDRLPPRA
ncbi:GFA family protein [Pseudooceanicola sp. LIPI14-2-Ac024]|uniref:GFA family protein n=1 Tax=Pseudooceanicola sp. LIPI14-2-Ac024 TaxID=3344875 RepID=UPI0035D00329